MIFSKADCLKKCYSEYEIENSIVYVGSPQKAFIKEYVNKYDSDFYEPLSNRVDLDVFSSKISDLAISFILVKDARIAGIIVAYFYEPESKKGYITLTHTKTEFRGQHVARALLDSVKTYAKSNGFLYVDLGVYKNNIAAYNLYMNYGFEVLTDDDIRCNLRLTL